MNLRKIIGPFGVAQEMDPTGPGCEATVFHWLVSAPPFHPMWSQYIVSAVDLTTQLPKLPPVIIDFKGATHEVLILALDPTESTSWTPEALREFATEGNPKYGHLPYLTPVNIHQQVTATDDELLRLAPFLMEAIVKRGLTPETSDAPDKVREMWREALEQGLEHMRGEHDDRAT